MNEPLVSQLLQYSQMQKPSSVVHVHGMEPQLLIPKVIRERIYESEYWKCNCVAVSFAVTLQKAQKLQFIGGTYGGNHKPTPFISLLLKLLQLGPSPTELQMMQDSRSKYAEALLVFYWRLTLPTVQVYEKLEAYYSDYRKLRMRRKDGTFGIIYFDEYVERLLGEDSVFQVPLPYLLKRKVLEGTGQVPPRTSILDKELLMESVESVAVEDDASVEDKEEEIIKPEVVTKKTGTLKTGKLKFKKTVEASSNEVTDLSVEETNALRAKLGLRPLS